MNTMDAAVVIGGGPAGLMAADVLAHGGVHVDLFDAMPSVGRKFLVAGKGGLNLSHAEELERFLDRYGIRRSFLESYLRHFGPAELRAWFQQLGYETYVGSSGRIFPKVMKAGPILHTWVQRLSRAGVRIHTRHRWLGWNEDGYLRFSTPPGELLTSSPVVILALGGGSWQRLGSDAAWVPLLRERGIQVAPLRPANCGFDVNWSALFKQRFAGQPIKTVSLILSNACGETRYQRGEFVVTENGIEGSLVYAFSADIRNAIDQRGPVEVQLDLAPDWSQERLIERLERPRGKRTFASYLERSVGISGVKLGLLRERLPEAVLSNPARLAAAIKGLPLLLLSPRPLDEAISTAGGVRFEELDNHLMLCNLPGVFCAGEMLDWEAPTGGYLLTACFSTGRAAGQGALAWLSRR